MKGVREDRYEAVGCKMGGRWEKGKVVRSFTSLFFFSKDLERMVSVFM